MIVLYPPPQRPSKHLFAQPISRIFRFLRFPFSLPLPPSSFLLPPAGTSGSDLPNAINFSDARGIGMMGLSSALVADLPASRLCPTAAAGTMGPGTIGKLP
jgi:hypothetical protein